MNSYLSNTIIYRSIIYHSIPEVLDSIAQDSESLFGDLESPEQMAAGYHLQSLPYLL